MNELNLNQIILKNLNYNEDFCRKTIPFLKAEYFNDKIEKLLFEEISNFVSTYSNLPTYEALVIQLNEKPISEEIYNKSLELLNLLHIHKDEKVDQTWLLEKSEEFCQERAIYNAVLESISILDGNHKQLSKGSIPGLLSEALGVSFDSSVGLDYSSTTDCQYDYYHKQEHKIPFDIDMFNKITKGGLPGKTLNILVAGCVDKDTKVRIRIKKNEWVYLNTEIKNIESLLSEYDVEIDSPDGYVKVSSFVDKGSWIGYKVKFLDKEIIVNENHLFFTDNGWELTKNLSQPKILHESGEYIKCDVEKTIDYYDIVDIQVDHKNHRYYADGLCSHNTNVGKTLMKCHFAAHFFSTGKNVLYITCEMSENEIAKRIDSNLLNIPMDELENISREQYIKKRSKIHDKTAGKLVIKEFPTGSASVAHFRILLNELRLKKNFSPDIIFIDYMNICLSSRMKMGGSINSYTYIKAIAEELRGLAVEYNVPILTSSQFNRSGSSSTDPNVEDISESHGTGMTADFIAAIISTEELDNLGQIMVKQIKSRYGDKSQNKRFVVGIDKSKSLLYDVENNAQKGIQDSGNSINSDVSMEEIYAKTFSKKKSFDDFTI